jgi:hypothetical protein
MITNNVYLDTYILSFLDIITTIDLAKTSKYCHQLISSTNRYIALKNAHDIDMDVGWNIGNVELLYWLRISYPCIFGCKDDIILNSLHSGRMSIIHYIIKRNTSIEMDKNLFLCIGADNGLLSIVTRAMSYGADIHFHDDAALRWSAENGHLQVVRYLVIHGANIHANNNYALRYSKKYQHYDVVKYLENIIAYNKIRVRFVQ